MPELPEVETTRRGISPHIKGRKVSAVIIRNASLRWPVPKQLPETITRRKLIDIHRRGKYLLFEFANGYLLVHLGMSGSMRVILNNEAIANHDHIDLKFGNVILRYNDPRRFGAMLWNDNNDGEVYAHKLLSHLGPEPLEDNFNGAHLFAKSRKRSQAVKTWIMDSKVVVGVGNIYANEALFNSGIHPLKAAQKLTKKQCDAFAQEIKSVLSYAIERGGTTLRDFVGGDGKPGYFAQELNVYGRGGKACHNCKRALTEKKLAQRTTVYCINCQK